MINFSDWLIRRKKQAPTTSVQPANTPQTPSKEEEDLDDLWQASADPHGLSDKRRKQLIAQNNPRFSEKRLKELEAMWKKSGEEDAELTPQQKANLPKHHMSPDELRTLWKSTEQE